MRKPTIPFYDHFTTLRFINMSNIFNKELQSALKEVYTDLEANELLQGNLDKAAKLGIYFAHGTVEKADNKLVTDQDKSRTTGIQLKEATKAKEVCGNIVTAATAAATDARNSNSYASTAAVNIQAAANSLTGLAADVAAIMAVATARDYGDKIHHLANRTYKLTQLAAKKAENTSLQSLNTAIEAAQSRAAVSLSQSKTLHTAISGLTKALDQGFESLQTKISADSSALAEAIAMENEQEGIYKTAYEEEKAMQKSAAFINQQVNYDLRFISIGNKGEQFEVAFNAFEKDKLLLEKGELESRKVINAYRIMFATVDDAPGFDIQAAEAVEERNYFLVKPKAFIKLNESITYKKHFVTAEYIAGTQNDEEKNIVESTLVRDDNEAVDYNGEALKRGMPYVVFVYVDYQSEMDDTDGYLSLPSLPFTLLTDLPRARKPKLHFYTHKVETNPNATSSNAMRVSFKVEDFMLHQTDLTAMMDFRVILFNQRNVLASKLNKVIDKMLIKLFQLDEASRVAEQTYLDAEAAFNTAVATGIGDEERLKMELAAAKTDYEQKTNAYNHQQDEIDLISEAKISNFFIDEEILASIPDAFEMDAKLLTPEPKDQTNPLETELAGLSAYGINEDFGVLDQTVNELREAIAEMEKSGANKKIVNKLKKELGVLEKELAKLEKDTSKGSAVPTVKEFVVINEAGDFTDNYGEPLMHNEKYVALVYSIIKPTEPEALPLFQAVYSSFSDGVEFKLQQL